MTYDVGVMGNGCLAGLVAITAGCSTVYPWGAVCIGAVAGWLYILGSRVSVALRVPPPPPLQHNPPSRSLEITG